MYIHKTPAVIAALFPDILWSVNTNSKELFLTFDDGPIPEATPWVLDELDRYNAKATFFMVGDNIRKHPGIFEDVIKRNHTVGNHTFNHLKGWKSEDGEFYHNVNKTEEILNSSSSNLFRPPHGRLKWSQYRALKNRYKIVMWDVLSGDFSGNLSAENCLRKTIQATRNGSIIVFHDSAKTIKKLKVVLPQYLDYFTAKDYTFKAL